MKHNQIEMTLSKSASFLLLAKIIGFGISFLLPLVIVRYLSKDAVGLYRETFLVLMNATTILTFGFSSSAFYFLARETERKSAAIFNILAFNFVVGGLACLTLFLFPQIIGNIFQSDEMTNLVPKIGVVIWIWVFSTFLETVAIANQEARIATVFIIFAQFSKTFLMVLAVVLFATVESFIYAAILQGALQTLILLIYLNSRFPKFWLDFRPAFFVEQMKYAVPFGLVGILWILQTDIHNYFVAHKFSSAEFAIYAYGCFQVPLIAMLAESVASVLIPKMSELEAKNDKAEMIRLTARAMQKLSFFYFPIYVFLIITAQTFIITLFTKNYLASVPIFLINLTLLPFSILITDPIVRAYQNLGRFLLVLRIFVLAGLVLTLYFNFQLLDMRGMIAVAIGAMLVEKFFAETFIVRKLGFGVKDFHLLKNVVKTAIAAVFAGLITYVFYLNTNDFLFDFGENLARSIFQTEKLGLLNFIGGGFTLTVTALIFAPIYLLATFYSGIIEADEIQQVRTLFRKMRRLFVREQIQNPQSQIQN